MHATPSVHEAHGKVVLAAAILTVANLLCLFLDIVLVLDHYDRHETTSYLVPQDVWSPFIALAWGQAALNGVILVFWRRTRPIGIGVLLGALAAVVLFFGWLVAVVAPALA